MLEGEKTLDLKFKLPPVVHEFVTEPPESSVVWPGHHGRRPEETKANR